MSLALTNLTILVVDDDADDCEHLRSLLEKSGASVMVARSVEEALELQRKSPPHVVIAEMHLGSSDGYAVIKAIREYNFEYRDFTPAIAITSFASHADKERALTAGFNAYVPRSIEPACIVDAITRVLRDSTDLAA
jgi:CheY-like chemotaxis protein